MDRALRRSRWALAAAVGLGLAGSAHVLLAAEPPVQAFVSAPARGHEAAAAAHLPELQIELAWLADPVTYPYHLAARAEGGVMHVCGYVQNKAARDRAVQLARAHCSLEIHDELRIHANLVVAGMAAAPTVAEVEACLAEALPKGCPAPTIQCRPDGQVILTGSIARLEDKLAVSQRLRQLAGCTAAVNQLALGAPTPAMAAPPARTEESQRLPEGPPTPAAEIPATHWQPEAGGATPLPEIPNIPVVPLPEGKISDPTATVPEGTGPSAAQAKGAPAKGRSLVPNTALLDRLTARVQAVCGNSAREIKLVPQTARDLRVEFKVRSDADGARLTEKILLMPELAHYHVDLDVKVDDGSTPPARPSLPTTRTSPAPVSSPPAVMTVPASPQAAPSRLEVPPPPSPWSPPKDLQPVSLKDLARPKESAPADGVIFMPAAPTPAPSWAPPAPAVTPPAPVPRPASSPMGLNRDVLKERVARLCGNRASDVQLSFSSPGVVQVAFTVRTETDGEALAARVMTMPELSAYHVDLDVKVADAPATVKTPPPPPRTSNPAPVVTTGPFPARPQTFQLNDPPVPPAPLAPVNPGDWHPVPAVPLPEAPKAAAKGTPALSKNANEGQVTRASFVLDPPGPTVRQGTANVVKPAEAPRGLETSGVVVVTEAAAPAPAPPPMALASLQGAVERVCGKRAEVHLVPRSASNLLVQFKARDAAEAERLTNAILGLAELIPYRVDVDVRLEH